MQFSNIDGSGIVQQVRDLTRVDSTQWGDQKVANSVNNHLDFIAGYAIGADTRFEWDDTNHTKLPRGRTNLVANQQEYSFLLDEQGNKIVTLTRLEVLDANGNWTLLKRLDEEDIDVSTEEFQKTAGVPQYYDLIADNIVRLYPKPSANVTSGLKFHFQRTPSYFQITDTNKEPGVSPLLHRGFVIAGAYDCALSLGLNNLQPLSVELQTEREKVKTYFADRNKDIRRKMTPFITNCK